MKIINLEKIEPKSISNIIFDWGGVITNINFKITLEAFSDLGEKSFEDFLINHSHNQILEDFEKGFISPEGFLDEIKRFMKQNISNELLKQAWCKMLLDTPPRRLEIIQALGEKYRIYLLSNTNKIHTDYYNEYLKGMFNIDYRKLFRKAYYSFELGLKKPDIKIFEHVLSDSCLDPSRTLFIDDTELNVDAASSLGILSLHLNQKNALEKIFQKWTD
jgi:HAD superfamily hydrolase (TIGR01509 family)